MKKIEAVVQSFKADEIGEALGKEKIPRITIFEVKGAGGDQVRLKAYRGVQYFEYSHQVKIEIVVDDDDAERIMQVIMGVLRSHDLGSGEVIVYPIEQAFCSRVGQARRPVAAEENFVECRSRTPIGGRRLGSRLLRMAWRRLVGIRI